MIICVSLECFIDEVEDRATHRSFSTDCSNAVLFAVILFSRVGGFLPGVILLLSFSVLLVLRLPRLGKRELILRLFVCLSDLCLFGFVGFHILLMSGKGCGL